MRVQRDRDTRDRRWPIRVARLVAAGGLLWALWPLFGIWSGLERGTQPVTASERDQRDLPDPAGDFRLGPMLSSWPDIGGCGVGGGATSGGGVKWVGRGVSGGLLDVQCTASQNFFTDGSMQTAFNTQLSHTLFYKWVLAANVPFLVQVRDVDVFGQTKNAELPGFGDVNLMLTRKLGITNAHALTLSAGLPTGSHDAVRQGVVLPRTMQLGSGTLSGSLIYEFTQDTDWGLLIYGGNVAFGGWENDIGDRPASSASGYAYAGYLLGPFVPSLGLTLTGKMTGDQEQGRLLPDQPYFLATINVALEWSMDWLALLLSSSLPFALDGGGLQSWSVALGLQTSLF